MMVKIMQRKRVFIISLLLGAIFAFSAIGLIAAHFMKLAGVQIITNNNLSESSFSSNEYYGDGINIMVNEHALNFSNYVNINPSTTLYGTAPVGWTGYNVKLDISNLQESGQWLGNVNCESTGGYWSATEESGGDPSDITEQYQTGDTYPGAGVHCLEITLDGWSTSTSLTNPELTGSGAAPTGWSYATGTSAYGTENRAPDVYECRTGGDGDRYYVWHNTQGGGLSFNDEEFSVKIYQTISLPADGDWVITDARLTYYWRMFDNGAGQDDWFQAHLRIGGVEVDGHPFLYYADGGVRYRSRSNIDVTNYFSSGTSWVIDFGFTGYINAPWPWQTEDIDAYWNELYITIWYRQRIDSGTKAYWSQTTDYSYAGRDLQTAHLDLAFRATGQIADGALSYIWAQVGSGGEWGTVHYISYSGTYQTLDQIQTSWVQADTIDVISDLRNFGTHSNIQIRLGITIGGLSFGLASDISVRFDYVRLTTTSYLDPDDANINFQIRDVTHATNYLITQTGQGSGSRSISNTWSGGIDHQFTFLINSQTYTVTFDAYLQMNETRKSVAMSNFTARDPYIYKDIEWMVNFDPVDIVKLSHYEFTIEVPNDWSPDRIWMPGSILNYELKTTAGLMTITTPAPPLNNTLAFYDPFIQNDDGFWRLRFYAPNYVYQIKTQIYTSTWEDTSKCYPTNSTRVNVLIKNDTMPWSQSMASRTIYRIMDENQNPTEEIINVMQGPVTSTEDNTLWTVPNSEIGTYKSVFRWNDTTTGNFPSKIGYNYSIFEIWRKTTVNCFIENLPDYHGTYLQPQFLNFKAQWSDSLTGTAVTGGTFYIEYNNTNNVLTNYTNYIEGKDENSGNYTIGLPTANVRMGDQTFILYLFKYYYDSKIIPFSIQQTIDVRTEVITPTSKWNATTYYAESLEIFDYNITCRFYDEYWQQYIVNGSDPWVKVEVTAQYVGGPLEYFSIDPNDNTLWYFTVDTSAFTGSRIYNVTMQVLQSSPYQYRFEVQTFLVMIQIVYSQTDLDAVQTNILYPPTGTGNGWSDYNNETDVYTANIYWNETFTLRVRYTNITSGSIPVTGATVQLIGWPDAGTLLTLTDEGNGNYVIQLVANTSYPIGAYDLYINASKPGYHSKTIYVKLNVYTRSTSLDKTPSTAYKLISYGGTYTILFTYKDTVPTTPIPMKNQSVPVYLAISGYSYYSITDHNNGSYSILLYANASIQEYEITFEFSRTNFETRIFVLTFKIELVHTTAVIDPPLVSMPYGDEYNITVNYYDVDQNYVGINGTIVIEWFDGYYNLTSFNNGTWIITITAPNMGDFYLNISLSKTYYESQNESIQVSVREIITLLTYDPPGSVPITAGGNVTIMLYYQDLDHSLSVTGATVELLDLKNETGHSLNLIYWIDWVVYDLGDGSYDVEFSMDTLGLGNYNVSFNVSKPSYAARQLYDIQFNIRRSYTQLTSPEAPSSTIPKGYYNITLNYRNRETGTGFNNISGNVHLEWNWPTNQTIHPNVSRIYQNQGVGVDGYYYVELNITADYIVPDDMFILYIHMSAGSDVEDQELNITIIITPAGTIIGYETPDAVVWNVNSIFNVTYTDLSGLGLPNATASDISINWTAGYYTISYMGGTSGVYQIDLNTSIYPPPSSGYFVLKVDASHTGYTPRTIYINIRVRPIDSLVTYTAPPSTPYNEISTFTIQYWDVYHDLPINGTSVNFKASYQSNDLGTYFSWNYDGTAGYFLFHINTSYWAALGQYKVQIDVSWVGEPYYQNQTIQITVPVQSRTTDLSYQNLETTPYNNTVVFTVIYKDIIATGSPGIEGASISVWYQGSEWTNGTDFAWVNEIGNGVYEVSINSAKLPSLGSFSFEIWANWSNIPFYQNKSIIVNINLVERPSDLNYNIEGSVAYSNMAILNVTYSDTETSNGLSNTSYYGGGHVSVDVYYQGQKWTNGTDFAWVIEVSEGSSPGLYMIYINTSHLAGLGSFEFTITAKWSGIPFFQNKSRQITITTRVRNTDLAYDAPPSTPIGDLVNITLYFTDLDLAGEGIDNSTGKIHFTANLTLYRVYDLNFIQKGKYAIEINTSDPALGIGSYIIQVDVKCFGAPYYSNKTRSIFLTIKLISTSLTIIDYDRVTWWNHNVTIILKYNDTDHSDSGIALPNVECGWGTWSYIEISPGGLILKLNTSVALQDYTTWVHLSKSNYVSQNITLPFTVRQIYTNYQNNASFVSNHPWSYNFTAEIEYLDIDNGGSVSGLTLSDIIVDGDDPWGTGGDFHVSLINNKFYIEFNTTACVEGILYTVNVTLMKANHQTQSFQIRVSVIYPPSAIFIKDISPATNIPWGQELRVVFTYNDTEGYNGISNSSGDVNIWLEGKAGEPGWPSSNYTIFENITLGPGVYTLVINTTWTGRPEGTYQLKILANATRFHQAIAISSITIRQTMTDLIMTEGPSTIYFGSSDTFTLWFNNTETVGDRREEGLTPATIQVWYKLSNGTLLAWDSAYVGGQYSVIDEGAGRYSVIINTSTNLGVGNFQLYFNASLDASWGIWQSHYEMGELLYTLRVIDIDTLITIIEQPSGSVAWGDNFTIRIGYNDTVNNIGIIGASISISGAGSIWTVFYNQTVQDPTYLIEINSTWVSASELGNSFAITIRANKTNYKTQQVNVFVIIRDIITTLSYDPFNPAPYNNTASTNVYYQDVVHSVAITNDTGQVRIILYNATTGTELSIRYSCAYTGTPGKFLISIETADLPGVGTYQFNVSIYWSGQPYYQNKSTMIELVVRKISTLISIRPISPVPWDNNVTIELDYTISDFESIENGNPINNANIVLVNGSDLSSYPIIYSVQYPIQTGVPGRYIIEIDHSNIQEVKSYEIWIFMNFTNCFAANASSVFQVRNLTTSIVIEPIDIAPYGNHVNISLQYRVVDIESDKYNQLIPNARVNITTPNFNNYGDYQTGNYTVYDLGGGYYIIQIWNHSLLNIATFNLDVKVSGVAYHDEATSTFSVQIRNLTTAVYILPIAQEPWGNSVNVTVYYQVLDSASQFYNNRGIEGAVINITTPGLNVYGDYSTGDYLVTELGNGYYQILIHNHSILQIQTYQIDVKASQVLYYDEATTFSSFEIRNLTTTLIVYAIPPKPVGNYVNLTVHYKIQDPDSQFLNNQPITGAKINITTSGHSYGNTYYVYELGNGDYVVQVLNITILNVGTYVLDFRAGGVLNHSEATSQGSFTIRPLITILEILPVNPVPYGNHANITVIYKVSDPESFYWDGLKIPEAKINITTPNYNIFGDYYTGNYTSSNLSIYGYYSVIVYNHSIDSIGSYILEIKASASANVQNATASITFDVRPLYTFLTYTPVSATPWGDNVTVELQWLIKDTISIYHNRPINNGELVITNPSNWSYSTDYTYRFLADGKYLLNISSATVNLIKLYTIRAKSFISNNIYHNATTDITFQVRQVFTTHTVIINGTYTGESYSGWPWGSDVPITIFYNVSELTHPSWELVPNSEIIVNGPAGTPYESGNYTVINHNNGTFRLIIDGLVAEHGVPYSFDIVLYTATGTYQNDSTTRISIWFRKATSQIFLKNPPLFVPWGDNITLIFTYNNTEAPGTPGLANAQVNVTVSNSSAIGYYNYYENPSWGNGSWYITMNTTWAAVTCYQEQAITFEISAVSPGTIVAEIYYTVIIQPINTELKIKWYDAAIWLESVRSFNATLELLDRSHYNTSIGGYNPIENNSHWMDGGSHGQYANIRFNLTTREGEFNNYTWYWGRVELYPTPSNGIYTLQFFFNETGLGYPTIQELLGYTIFIEVFGDHLSIASTQITVDLRIHTHDANVTFDWNYVNSTITPNANISYFAPYQSQYYYGDLINISLYFWDLDSGAYNPGISAAHITCNWTDPLYYRVFNQYQLHDLQDEWRGIFTIQIDTRMYDEVVGHYVLQINATLETYQRAYITIYPSYYIEFDLLPVPVNISLVETPHATPITAQVRLLVNFTNFHTSEPVYVRVWEVDIINIPGPMGASKWASSTGVPGELELFIDSNILGIGWHIATVQLNKTNYELVKANFSFYIREIYTQIVLRPIDDEIDFDGNLTGIYRYNYSLQFYYTDDPEIPLKANGTTYGYNPIGLIPLASFNISNWLEVGGHATKITDEVPNGLYEFIIQTSADVGVYYVTISANRTNFAKATKIIRFEVWQAASQIELVDPPQATFQIWKFGSRNIRIYFRNEFFEPMNATIRYNITDANNNVVATGIFIYEGNGYFTAKIDTNNLKMQETYYIIVNATPTNTNYAGYQITLTALIKPFWEHPIFIFAMIGLAAAVGVYTYRKVKWILLPREIKAVELAKKAIKSGKTVEVPFRDIKDRELMFRMLFADAWATLNLKPPKLVSVEVVALANELSSILRTKVTTPEAELLKQKLETMELSEAERYLSEMKVPPEASRRILSIVGLIKKERMEYLEFAKKLSEIKGIEMDYNQAEEIINTLLKMPPVDADRYLEAMVITKEDRITLLKMLGIEPPAYPEKGKPLKEMKKKLKKITKEDQITDSAVRRMSEKELIEELNKIPGLTDKDKKKLLEHLKEMSYEEQKTMLETLKS